LENFMLSKNIKALILDMDGVLWRGDAPIGDLAAIFRRIKERGLRVVFATNNSIRTPAQYVERLRKFGVDCEDWQVVTSSLAAADLLSRRFAAGTPIFVIGEDGLRQAAQEKGFVLLEVEQAPDAQAVLMGIDRDINFQKLAEATLLVRRGVPFYASNPDKTFPTPRGEIPGAGSWFSIVVTASNVEPIVAGKPGPAMMELALQRLNLAPENVLVVGDRIETDIMAGQSVGCPCALVLSGVSTQAEGEAWNPKIDLIAEDLASLIG
jgi:4-nitrophenyl phosphatase